MNRMLPLALVAVIVAVSGCTTHAKLKRTKPDYSNALANRPPSVFEHELRRHQVNDRASSLYSTGKYATIGEARKVAERDIASNSDDAAERRWALQQASAQKRKASQARFEKELAAMSRP